MNTEQAKLVIDEIAATWRGEMTADQIAVWYDSLAARQPAHARTAIRALREVTDFVPSHAEFAKAYDIAKRRADIQHQEQMLGQPGGKACDCDGGWIWHPTPAGSSGVVKRCPRCHPAPESAADHPKGCTCMTCHHGVDKAAEIRAGGAWSTTSRNEPTLVERDRAREHLNTARALIGAPVKEYVDADDPNSEWGPF